MTSRSNPLAKVAPATAVSLLNVLLATAIDLQAQLKQAHWNVHGPGVTALHAVFDRAATDVGRHMDLLAERISSIGGLAVGTVQIAAKQSFLPRYPSHSRDIEQNVAAVSAALVTFGVSIRAAIDGIRVLGDFATMERLGDILRGIEQNLLWIAWGARQARGDDATLHAFAVVPSAIAGEIPMRERIEDWLNGGALASDYLTER